MSFLEWSSEYEFGIPEMDKQHKRWLELLNTFYDNLESKNMKKHLLKMLDEAIEYTHYHFKEEEALMSTIGYPALQDQKMLHKEIAKKIENFREKIAADKEVVSMVITNEFKSWFKTHILIEDKKYVDMYKKIKK